MMDETGKSTTRQVPSHVAIIMDGNGRWAQARGLDRSQGHVEGVNTVRRITEVASEMGVKYLTLYAFSTENWNRPPVEGDALLPLIGIAIDAVAGKIVPENIDEATVSRYLNTSSIPDPDLLIRTGGDLRVSNFLLWQIAYAEIYVTPTYWPDFTKDAFREALAQFGSRERRFGLTGEQVRSL